jgi:putative transposase
LNNRESNAIKKEALKMEIKQIFEDSGGSYGAKRICGVLRKRGYKVSYKKISDYMLELGISSIHNRHKRSRSITDSRKSRGTGYPNLVRGQSFTKPLTALSSDITYQKSGEGWVYLCVIKDIVSREILGESTSDRLQKELTIHAFLNAQGRHQIPKGAIFHSDRGSQYTSHEFKELLRLNGIRQSFSRVGMPGDNAWSESFFATLKKECTHFRHFDTRDELRQAMFAWIEGFYNPKRVQAKLGYLSPRQYKEYLLADIDIEKAA